jgi:hypothetical protein
MSRPGSIVLLSPSAPGAGLLPDCDLSSLEATRVMGGSCGGYGDMGELDT